MFEKLDCECRFDATPWTADRLYTAVAMKKSLFSIALVLVAATLVLIVRAAPEQSSSRSGGKLTIEQLIDIRHPSNPVWSPDGRHVAFLSERAGIANIFAADISGSTPAAPRE